jgi:hypothetical protein
MLVQSMERPFEEIADKRTVGPVLLEHSRGGLANYIFDRSREVLE